MQRPPSKSLPKTKVVNLRRDPYDVYIGRPGKGEPGYFGNPIRVGDVCFVCGKRHTSGAFTIPCYRDYFYSRLAKDPDFKRNVEKLRGKVLGCFCKPKPCHGDVIVEYLERH
jgi:hypothetical protein